MKPDITMNDIEVDTDEGSIIVSDLSDTWKESILEYEKRSLSWSDIDPSFDPSVDSGLEICRKHYPKSNPLGLQVQFHVYSRREGSRQCLVFRVFLYEMDMFFDMLPNDVVRPCLRLAL